METLLATILTSALSALAGAVVSAVVTKAHASTEQMASRQRSLQEALLALLKAELFDLHHRYVELDEPLDAMGMQLASSVYHVYHDELGGNGLGEKLYSEIQAKGVGKHEKQN